MRIRTAAVALWLSAAPSVASAHDFWVEPSSFEPKVGDAFPVRLFVGDDFPGEELPRSREHRERFEILAPGTTTEVRGGRDGQTPGGVARLEGPGLHWIVYRSRESTTEVEAEKFGPYLVEEGNERWVSDWKARDPSQKTAVKEAFSRAAKALVNVDGTPAGREPKAAGFDRVAGLVFEIVPETNPLSLSPGDELPVRLLWQGKPIAGQQVMARSEADPKTVVKARTDADGRVRVRLARPGLWVLGSVHFDRAGPDERVQYRSVWTTLTFSLPAPAPAGASTPP
jgi:uncharacterized GH25 family protein